MVEAVFEDVGVKTTLWHELDGLAPPATIFASNTSSIAIDRLAEAVSEERRARFVGMHFFSPVPVMPLIELIRGAATTDETEATIRALSAELGKQVIVSADRPGFIVNRILMPFLAESMRAYEEGLGTAEDIDTGARVGLNHPMGPLQLADFIGLDVCLEVMRVLYEGFGQEHVPAAEGARGAGRGRAPRPEDRAGIPHLPEVGSACAASWSAGLPGRLPEDRLDGAAHRVAVERLRQEADPAALDELTQLRVEHVTAHEHDPPLELGPDGHDRVEHLGAAHARHPVVAQDGVERRRPDQLDGLLARGRDRRLVAGSAEPFLEQHRDRRLVVQDEDAYRAMRAVSRSGRFGHCDGVRTGRGERHGERRPDAVRARLADEGATVGRDQRRPRPATPAHDPARTSRQPGQG